MEWGNEGTSVFWRLEIKYKGRGYEMAVNVVIVDNDEELLDKMTGIFRIRSVFWGSLKKLWQL